eukprot:8064264-Pyramimonas_sp.AAC.1
MRAGIVPLGRVAWQSDARRPASPICSISHPQSIAAQAGISNDRPSMIVFTLGLIFQPLAAAHGDITSTSYTTTTSASIPSPPSLASSSSHTDQEGGALGHIEDKYWTARALFGLQL